MAKNAAVEVDRPTGRKFLYSVANAAAALDISVSKFYEHVRDGTIRPVALGGRTMVSADELQRVVSSLKPKAAP